MIVPEYGLLLYSPDNNMVKRSRRIDSSMSWHALAYTLDMRGCQSYFIILWTSHYPLSTQITQLVNVGKKRLYDLCIHEPGCEGIVLKHTASHYAAGLKACLANLLWIKVKKGRGAHETVGFSETN